MTTAQSVKVWICINGRAELYADGAQLEKNSFAGPYNCMENGGFERGTSNWSLPVGAGVNTSDSFTGSRSLFIQGNLDSRRTAEQSVDVHCYTDVRESFTLSGFARAVALPEKERSGGKIAQMRLVAKIIYGDNTEEEHAADFSPSTTDWQFGFVRFSKSKFKAMRSLQVFCEYSYNIGTARFDCIQLVRNNYETGLTKYAFPAEYDTEEEQELSPAKKTEPDIAAFEEAVDPYGNRITETIFQEGKHGTIYRSFGYNQDDANAPGNNAGNDQIRTTDERGYNTWFSVDRATFRIDSVLDRCENLTRFSYGENGRLSEMAAYGQSTAPLATVSYAYDKAGNLTAMTRGDGKCVTYSYNSHHKLSNIASNSTGFDARYAYKNDHGRLKGIGMIDGSSVTYVYNRFGQILSETWTKNRQQTHRYKYAYDSSGQIVRVIDIGNKKEYNYSYKKGSTIGQVRENAVEVDANEVVYSREPICTVGYQYSGGDTLTGKRIQSGSFTQEYRYSVEPDGTRIVTMPGGAKSQYNTDHFGRKTSDEVKFSAGYLTRKYTYQPGQVTAEHIQNKKVKSEATTRLVETIQYSSSSSRDNALDGRLIRYTYDGEQRITQVTDSVEGITQYTYNELGQLIGEHKDNPAEGRKESTGVEYDGYGNIQKKGGKEYSYDAVYRDRLIGYGAEEIRYVGMLPNPVSYRGWELKWHKGGQLAEASRAGKTLSFTYNLGNVRTERIVNGKRYRYIVDGTRILWDEYKGAEYLYDSEGKVCGMVYEGKTYYFVKNLQGDVISITTDTGSEIVQYSYDAWGVCRIKAAPAWEAVAEANVFRYRSYVYDDELGMYYLHNRYYDPEVGRFISMDPAMDGTNWYAYCGCDAVNYVDPEGLWSKANLGYQAQAGDTLWGLAEEVFQGQGWKWRDLGYPYDVNKRPLQEGDIIAYQGGLIEYENGVPYIHAAHVVYENNGYHTPEKMPDPPEPKPQEPTASGGGATSKPGSVSSTSKPGNVNASGMTSGGLKPGGGQTNGFGAGRNDTPPGYNHEGSISIFDLTEFNKESDTYKIINDLSIRSRRASESAEQKRLSQIAQDARRLAREGTPYMYGQEKVMAVLHTNVATAETYRRNYLNYAAAMGNPFSYFFIVRILGLEIETIDPYIWFVNMTCTAWNYKLVPEWQVGHHSNKYRWFEGNDMDLYNNWNWVPWIYFEGDIWGADQIGNINLAYVGYKMGYKKSFLIDNFATRDDERDGKALDMGFALAEQGR